MSASLGATRVWADGSGSNSRRDLGDYILAAAIISIDVGEANRTALKQVLLRGQSKLQWRQQRPAQDRIVDLFGTWTGAGRVPGLPCPEPTTSADRRVFQATEGVNKR